MDLSTAKDNFFLTENIWETHSIQHISDPEDILKFVSSLLQNCLLLQKP